MKSRNNKRQTTNDTQQTVSSEQPEVVEKDVEKEELKARLVRAMADYENLSKRFLKEREEFIIRANKGLLENLLPILDNLERAQAHLRDKGLGMAIGELAQVIKGAGIKEIEIKRDDEFDSNLHEAIDSIEGEKDGKIAEVAVKGYKWVDGRVLRPAKVIVYKGN